MKVCFESNPSKISLQYRDKLRISLAGVVLPTVQDEFFARTGTCVDFDRRTTSLKLANPNLPDLVSTLIGCQQKLVGDDSCA